jgi:thymidine kinase
MINHQLITYVGPMFSGKTSAMLMKLETYKHQGKKLFIFKPQIDNRYSNDCVVTHLGWSVPAIPVFEGKNIIKHLSENADVSVPSSLVVAVDELFMINGASKELIWLFEQGITVIVSTLDLNSNCKPFQEVSKIFPYATHIEKLSAVCSVCNEEARYTWKKNTVNDEEIAVGGSELYEARCWKHHPKFKKSI